MRTGMVRIFIYIQFFLLMSLFLIFIHSRISLSRSEKDIKINQRTVMVLGLTDMCLTTEARYTRNPSQADYFTPFQDNPLSLELFPSGGAMAPPGFVEMPTKIIVK